MNTQKILVKVTDEDIEEGEPESSAFCPVATRLTKMGYENVDVFPLRHENTNQTETARTLHRNQNNERQPTMTTTTTPEKKITITLSERAPVSIKASEWPLIASASAHNGEHEFQANRLYRVRVRIRECDPAGPAKSRDVLVYALLTAGNGGMFAHEREVRAGYLLTTHPGEEVPQADIVRAIRRAAGAIGRDDLAAECIGDLPAEDL